MVIADAESPGPIKKRPRLSLKFLKSGNNKDVKSATPKKEKQESSDIKECNEAKTVQELAMSEDSLGSYDGDDRVVPAVASLENLGNTCFLNSILQVLRFTPGFLSGLEDLHREIVLVDKLKRQESVATEDEPRQSSLTSDLVKDLYKLYKGMERREERHPDVASSDVMSMALKPDRILSVIRELNPMFEGHLQHDAQELLRCVLCYLQDASKEVKKDKNTLPPCMLPSQTKGPVNPIMQKFLASKAEKKENLISPIMHQTSFLTTHTIQDGVDFLDQIERCEAAKTAAIEHSQVPQEADVPNFHLKNQKKEKVLNGEVNGECSKKSFTETNVSHGENIHGVNGGVEKISRSRLGKRKSQSDDTPVKESEPQTEDSKEDISTRRSKRCRKPTEKALLNKPREKEIKKEDSSQPSILSMFGTQGSSKRLGMRGALIRKNVNNSSGSGSEVLSNGDEGTEVKVNRISKENRLAMYGITGERIQRNCGSGSQIKIQKSISPSSENNEQISPKKEAKVEMEQDKKVVSSVKVGNSLEEDKVKSPTKLSTEFQKLNCQKTECPSPKTKHPLIKLEKCDHVCNSPKKSVNANYAERTLSPFKVQTPVSEKMTNTGSAKHRLDFSDDSVTKCRAMSNLPTPGKLCKIIQTIPKKSKMDFVENLFMGSMMLRTKCLECEFSRERIEEFHDISVPVKKEKNEDDEDDNSMDSDEDQNSCLAKLMEAFTEVERLRDENKYFCDKCNRHVEAERSLHYEVLPDILTLHLKRFSTCSGLYGYVSKINDHVTIPLSLPCLRYKCPSPCCRPDHRYRLFALVTHAGMTLTSGHYLSYVRVMGSNKANGDAPCGAAMTSYSPFGMSTSPSSLMSDRTLSTPHSEQSVLQTTPQKSCGQSNTDFLCVPRKKYEQQWLECDDETIRTYSEDRFCNLLKGINGSLMGTPYVLFYHRVLPGTY